MEHKRATEQERATRNDVNNHIAEQHLQTGRNIKSIGILRHALLILQATIIDSLTKAGSLTEDKRHWIEVSIYRPLQTDSSRQNW